MSVDAAAIADWLGTFAIHSTCAFGAALLLGVCLRDRAAAWQEQMLRFVLWAPLVSSTLQFVVLGGPWTGGFVPRPAPSIVAVDPTWPTDLAVVDAMLPTALPARWPGLPWSTWLLAGATLAAAVGLFWHWRSQRRLVRALAARHPESDPRVLAAVESVAQRLGLRRPLISRCETLPTPIAFGLWRPEVCLPSRVAELGAASLAAMLAHELAHLRRRDPAVMAAGALLQALFPWQVLLPLVRRRWLRLVELRCDAIAAGHTSPTAVARCLLEVAEWLRPPAMPALGMAARPSGLRDRVEAALQHRVTASPRRLWSLSCGGVSLSALTVVAPGLHAVPVAPPIAELGVIAVSPATDLEFLLEEHAVLSAEAERLQAELVDQAVSPELEQLLSVLRRRLSVVGRLAARIQVRLDASAPEAR